MSHIFGLSHTLGGLADQALGWLGGGVSGFAATPPSPNQFLTNAPVVDDVFGGGVGAATAMVAQGGSCGPVCGPKTQRFITTVCPDGSTTIRPVKSRRRKRRLASMSDIKDLAALKNILGGGKAFDTWIATRGR